MKKMHKVATGLVVLSFAMLPMSSLAAEKAVTAKAPAKVEAPAKTQPTAPKVVKPSHKVKHHRGGMSHVKAMEVAESPECPRRTLEGGWEIRQDLPPGPGKIPEGERPESHRAPQQEDPGQTADSREIVRFYLNAVSQKGTDGGGQQPSPIGIFPLVTTRPEGFHGPLAEAKRTSFAAAAHSTLPKSPFTPPRDVQRRAPRPERSASPPRC